MPLAELELADTEMGDSHSGKEKEKRSHEEALV
jgi:hypothetical protein